MSTSTCFGQRKSITKGTGEKEQAAYKAATKQASGRYEAIIKQMSSIIKGQKSRKKQTKSKK